MFSNLHNSNMIISPTQINSGRIWGKNEEFINYPIKLDINNNINESTSYLEREKYFHQISPIILDSNNVLEDGYFETDNDSFLIENIDSDVYNDSFSIENIDTDTLLVSDNQEQTLSCLNESNNQIKLKEESDPLIKLGEDIYYKHGIADFSNYKLKIDSTTNEIIDILHQIYFLVSRNRPLENYIVKLKNIRNNFVMFIEKYQDCEHFIKSNLFLSKMSDNPNVISQDYELDETQNTIISPLEMEWLCRKFKIRQNYDHYKNLEKDKYMNVGVLNSFKNLAIKWFYNKKKNNINNMNNYLEGPSTKKRRLNY